MPLAKNANKEDKIFGIKEIKKSLSTLKLRETPESHKRAVNFYQKPFAKSKLPRIKSDLEFMEERKSRTQEESNTVQRD